MSLTDWAPTLIKEDSGHEFHGNQYAGGGAVHPIVARAAGKIDATRAAAEAKSAAAGDNPHQQAARGRDAVGKATARAATAVLKEHGIGKPDTPKQQYTHDGQRVVSTGIYHGATVKAGWDGRGELRGGYKNDAEIAAGHLRAAGMIVEDSHIASMKYVTLPSPVSKSVVSSLTGWTPQLVKMTKKNAGYLDRVGTAETCIRCSMFRDGTCTLVDGVISPAGGCIYWESRGTTKAKEIAAAGIAVVAKDTGRVLLMQRSIEDDDDVAAGKWEFPGGKLEEGEDPWDAAEREWCEETGATLPHGKIAGTWTSTNGVYQAFVYTIDNECDLGINLDHEDRDVLNPDDPDGDCIEVVAWWYPNDAEDSPAALREEMSGTDWSMIRGAAGVQKVGEGWADGLHPRDEHGRFAAGDGKGVDMKPATTGTSYSHGSDGNTIKPDAKAQWAALRANPNAATHVVNETTAKGEPRSLFQMKDGVLAVSQHEDLKGGSATHYNVGYLPGTHLTPSGSVNAGKGMGYAHGPVEDIKPGEALNTPVYGKVVVDNVSVAAGITGIVGHDNAGATAALAYETGKWTAENGTIKEIGSGKMETPGTQGALVPGGLMGNSQPITGGNSLASDAHDTMGEKPPEGTPLGKFDVGSQFHMNVQGSGGGPGEDKSGVLATQVWKSDAGGPGKGLPGLEDVQATADKIAAGGGGTDLSGHPGVGPLPSGFSKIGMGQEALNATRDMYQGKVEVKDAYNVKGATVYRLADGRNLIFRMQDKGYGMKMYGASLSTYQATSGTYSKPEGEAVQKYIGAGPLPKNQTGVSSNTKLTLDSLRLMYQGKASIAKSEPIDDRRTKVTLSNGHELVFERRDNGMYVKVVPESVKTEGGQESSSVKISAGTALTATESVIGAKPTDVAWGQAKWGGVYAQLTPSERTGIKNYTGSYYHTINKSIEKALRDGGTDPRVPGIDKALARQPMPEAAIVVRGEHWEAFKDSGTGQKVQVDQAVGKTFLYKGYTSTSVGYRPGLGSSNGVRLVLHVPPGTPAMYVDPISSNKGERELVLGRNIGVKIDSVTPTKVAQAGGDPYASANNAGLHSSVQYIVHATVIPPKQMGY